MTSPNATYTKYPCRPISEADLYDMICPECLRRTEDEHFCKYCKERIVVAPDAWNYCVMMRIKRALEWAEKEIDDRIPNDIDSYEIRAANANAKIILCEAFKVAIHEVSS